MIKSRVLGFILTPFVLVSNCLADGVNLKEWDAPHAPATVGKKVVENFLKRGHYQDHKDFRYPDAVTWFGAFKVVEKIGDKDLEERLIRRFDYYLKPATRKHFPAKDHVDYAVLGVVPLEIYRRTQDAKYRDLGLRRADAQWEKPTGDGLTSQARYWVDDIYMISAIQTTA